MTNIPFTHKFTDPYAKVDAARQNLEQMMYLFWFDNVPGPMRESRVWRDDTKEQIEEWLDEQTNALTTNYVHISDFLSRLVSASQESFRNAKL